MCSVITYKVHCSFSSNNSLKGSKSRIVLNKSKYIVCLNNNQSFVMITYEVSVNIDNNDKKK